MNLKSQRRGESGGNYIDMETGESFWVSGVKENGQDRHRAGSGKVLIGAAAVSDYLDTIKAKTLDMSRCEITNSIMFWVLIRTARSTLMRVPRLWSIGTVITWTNAMLYAAGLPIGDPRNRMWPATALWFGLNGDDMLLVYARASSSVHSDR